jgi:hypothetical protein
MLVIGVGYKFVAAASASAREDHYRRLKSAASLSQALFMP